MDINKCDIAVIGGGIVGLATTLALQTRFPHSSIVVLEKEPGLARHQTGRNSGVIHAGIYYRPGSYKARLCVEGSRLMMQFCAANGVRYERCGKLIVATDARELPALMSLHERGQANGIPGLELVGPERAKEIEPHVSAVQALYSPDTAITDFEKVAHAMGEKIVEGRGAIMMSTLVRGVKRSDGGFRLETSQGDLQCQHVINCAGLHADSIARLMGMQPDALLIPFRGEYYSLAPECCLVRALIYPVPNPEFPFLGVHFTKRIEGGYEAGPNAVLAFAREGYSFRDVCFEDLASMATFSGFWAMAWRYWRTEAYELYRSFSKRAFLRALQRLVPELQDHDLRPGGAGVRAQIVDSRGALIDDFLIMEAPGAIHVLNAPSPAATASIAIGRHIADLATKSFQ